MARIVVMPDSDSETVVLTEWVKPLHLDDEHSSVQLLERLAWAIHEAEPKPTRTAG